MYGGLFGDLPAAKNSKAGGESDTVGSSVSQDSSNKLKDDAGSSTALTGGVTGVAITTAAKPAVTVAASSVTAFVPTAATRKRRSTTSSRPLQQPASTNSKDEAARPPPSSFVAKPRSISAVSSNAPGSVSLATTTTIIRSAKSTEEDPCKSIHASEILPSEKKHSEKTKTTDAPALQETSTNIYPQSNTVAPFLSESDQQRRLRLKKLEEDDPYDPMVPNDLLQYWEKKAVEQQRLQLQAEQQRILAQQEQMRVQLERERQELSRKGQMEQLVEHRLQHSMAGSTVGSGHGRGRGVSNLPAWLVEKQRIEADQLNKKQKVDKEDK